MTGQFAPYGVPDPAVPGEGPEAVPGSAVEMPGRQCSRCGAVGTHYLTCPGLRLPPDYHLGDASGPE